MKKKSIFLLEIFIWIFILGALISYGINSLTKQGFNSTEYQVEFKDIDNLAVGSPIRLMGIQVGHVTKIIPQHDKVQVTFIVPDKNLAIPDGSTLNIQFTGMAGSKSIEIDPPGFAENSNVMFKVREPIRVNSLIELQANMSKSILDFSSSFLSFFGNGGIEAMQHNIKLSKEMSNAASYKAQSTSNIFKTVNKAITENSEPVKETLTAKSQSTDAINSYSEKILHNNENRKIIKSFASGATILSNSTDIKNKLNPTYNYLTDVHVFLECLNNKTSNRQFCKPDDLSYTLTGFDNFLNNFSNTLNFINNKVEPEKIDKFHKKVKSLKNNATNLEKSIN